MAAMEMRLSTETRIAAMAAPEQGGALQGPRCDHGAMTAPLARPPATTIEGAPARHARRVRGKPWVGTR